MANLLPTPAPPVRTPREHDDRLARTARHAFVTAVVVVAVVAVSLGLWQLRDLVMLLFMAVTLAAAVRPGAELAHRRLHLPRGLGVVLQYLLLLGLFALFVWLVVPPALNQVESALGPIPTSRSQLHAAAQHATGIRRDILLAVQRHLHQLPSASQLVHPALSFGQGALSVLIDTFFVLAAAAYWVLDRDRVVEAVAALLPEDRRDTVRATWTLVDAKLGAFVRGEALMVVLVGTVLSLAFWVIGVPYWILLGAFAGVVELIPVVGPLTAGALAVGAGLTVSWTVAAGAAIAVLVVRQVQDTIVAPRVLGDAVGLSPLLVLIAVFAVDRLFGGVAVILAIPLAAVVATVVDVIVLHRDPRSEDVAPLMFPGEDRDG